MKRVVALVGIEKKEKAYGTASGKEMKLKSGEAELVTATSGSTAPSPVQPHNNSLTTL